MIENHRFSSYFDEIKFNKIMKNIENEEIHVFTWNLWFFMILHILGHFGKFYEIRKIQLNLPTKLYDFEHLF